MAELEEVHMPVHTDFTENGLYYALGLMAEHGEIATVRAGEWAIPTICAINRNRVNCGYGPVKFERRPRPEPLEDHSWWRRWEVEANGKIMRVCVP